MNFSLVICQVTQYVSSQVKSMWRRISASFKPAISQPGFHGTQVRALDSFSDRHNEAKPTVKRPLRVVQIKDHELSDGGFGRIIISGKMSDVCAELDRLVAHEAACM